jgi:O-succinylbenzoic acid--CoA ligase
MDWLYHRSLATPKKTALIFGDRKWSYHDLNAQVDVMTAWLANKGMRPGDSVPVLAPNSPEYVWLIHALARIGAVLVPLNTRLTANELEWQLDRIGSQWLLYDEAMAERALALNRSTRIVEAIDASRLGEPSTEPPLTTFPSFSNLDALQAIVFTSGTSGTPKGVKLSYANHFWSATASAFRLGLSPEDRWLSCLPLYHVGGLAVIFRSALYGTAVVLQEGFNVLRINRALDTERVTLVSLVPTMLHRLLQERKEDEWPDSLRLALLGGAAASPELVTHCQDLGLPLATTYGLTEAASQVATMLPTAVQRKPGSVGKPLMFTSVRIADEQGQTLPADELGEVVVSGPTVMSGYFSDNHETAAALRHGELYTGDIGRLDEDGDLWLVQRRSDVILTGGEKVYPAEVEAVLRRHPAVKEVCIAGINDVEWGQRVVAMIVRPSELMVSEAELVRYCRQRLAGYKLPRLFRFVEELPRTASGKVHRQAVIELMEKATTP